MNTDSNQLLDLLIAGGTIITGDREERIIENAVIGIKDAKIVYMGTLDIPQALQAKKTILGVGCVITPGLINVHTHTMLSMLRGQAEDMGFAPAYTKGIPQGFHMTPDDARAMAQLGALEALLFGSTLIWDTYVHAEVAIEAIAELGIRVATSSRIHDVDLAGLPDGNWTTDLRIGERLLDETIQLASRYNGKTDNMIAVHLMPHAPDTCSHALLRAIKAASDEYGLLIHTHLAQSRTEVAYICEKVGKTPVEYLLDLEILSDRLTAAHCIFVTDSDIELMKRSGMTVAHIPKGNITGGTKAPTHIFRQKKINVAIGTDNMHGDMIEAMRWALNTGRIQEGCVSDFWQPKDAFNMATMAGARALRLDNLLGSIEIGKAADLVLLDFNRPHLTPHFNPLGTLMHTAQGRDVKTVVIAGKIVVEDGHSTLCDEIAVIETASRVAKNLWKKATG